MKPASAELQLPNYLRRYLSKPWTLFRVELIEGPREFVAQVLKARLNPFRVSVVGDVVCSTITRSVGIPRLCVADLKTLRFREAEVEESLFHEVRRCRNPRGSISRECVEALIDLLKGQTPSLLLVDGEEDLLALPLVAVGATDVAFGIPERGVCIVPKCLDNSVAAINTLSKFVGFEAWSLDRYAEILG